MNELDLVITYRILISEVLVYGNLPAEDGEINIMFAPVNNMKGDTVNIKATAVFADGYRSSKELNIILE